MVAARTSGSSWRSSRSAGNSAASPRPSRAISRSAEITDRVSKGPPARNVALLFERVEGFDMPVLINAFGSPERMAWALGVERLDELGERRRASSSTSSMPGTFAEKLAQARHADRPRQGRATAREHGALPGGRRDGATLAGRLPALQCWPGDGGRYITLPGVFTRDPRTGARNVGMYRLQVFDDQTLGMHWQTHKGGAEHQRVAGERTRRRVGSACRSPSRSAATRP